VSTRSPLENFDEAPTPAPRKRVGVIGSFVWDVILGRDPRDAPVEEWGGITYALGALEAALPDDWEFVPIARSGTIWRRVHAIFSRISEKSHRTLLL
jgi:hypothetical protein